MSRKKKRKAENETGNGGAKQGSFMILNKIKSAVLVLFRQV